MGRVVVTEFVSLDGVIEDPGGAEGYKHGGWTFDFDRGEDGDKFKLDETLEAEAMLLGRVTYEGFAAAWPSMEDPVGFADKMNGMPKYVVSSTLTDPEWNNSTVLEGDLAESVARLKDETEGDILVGGSAQLAQGLARAGLVDEYRLMVSRSCSAAASASLPTQIWTTRPPCSSWTTSLSARTALSSSP